MTDNFRGSEPASDEHIPIWVLLALAGSIILNVVLFTQAGSTDVPAEAGAICEVAYLEGALDALETVGTDATAYPSAHEEAHKHCGVAE